MNHTDYTDDDLDDVVTELTPEQCWALLEGEEFGRLAFRLVSEVHIVPINYSVEHRVLLFPTTSGNKLLPRPCIPRWPSRSTGTTTSRPGPSSSVAPFASG